VATAVHVLVIIVSRLKQENMKKKKKLKRHAQNLGGNVSTVHRTRMVWHCIADLDGKHRPLLMEVGGRDEQRESGVARIRSE
jgi:hypothetical protein